MESLDISVILPIKSGLVRDFDEYFDKAIKSLQIQEVSLNELIIVHTEEETLVEKLKNNKFHRKPCTEETARLLLQVDRQVFSS